MKWLPVLVIGAVTFGVTLFLLRSGKPDPAPAVAVTAQSGAAGELRQLNEVQVRMTPPPAGVPAAAVAGSAVTAPMMPMVRDAPPPLEREYDLLLDRSAMLKEAHSVFEREAREEPWATLMERKWQDAFAANPDLLAYGTPTAHCRTTRCEVRLVTSKPVTMDRDSWPLLVIGKAGQRNPDDQSVPLVSGINQTLQSSADSDGARVTLIYYDYKRDTPAAR